MFQSCPSLSPCRSPHQTARRRWWPWLLGHPHCSPDQHYYEKSSHENKQPHGFDTAFYCQCCKFGSRFSDSGTVPVFSTGTAWIKSDSVQIAQHTGYRCRYNFKANSDKQISHFFSFQPVHYRYQYLLTSKKLKDTVR